MNVRRIGPWAIVGIAAAGLAGFLATRGKPAGAADHLDPPGRTNPAMGGTDRNSDITDVYAWHQGTGAAATMVNIVGFSGPNMPVAGQKIPCDPDVLYTIHLSNDADLEDEFTINARFAEDDLHHCFIKVEGIPGVPASASVQGPVELNINQQGVKVRAGLFDDAFFFDLQGFKDTESMTPPMIRMTSDRDFFAGQNTPAIVIEYPLAAVSPTGQVVRVWASTSRITAP